MALDTNAGDYRAGEAGLQFIQEGRRKLELPDLIHYVDAFETPFVSFTSKAVKGKKATDDYKFYIHEKRPIADRGWVKAISSDFTAGANKGDIIFGYSIDSEGGTMVAGNTILRENDLIQFTTDSKRLVCRIIEAPTAFADNASVTARALNSIEPTDLGVGAGDTEFVLLSPSYVDGDTKGTSLSKTTESDYNYTQIMRMPIEVTYRMANANLHGPDKLALMKRDAIRNWKRQLERNFLFGARSVDTTDASGHERSTTEGFVTWLMRKADTNANVPIIDRTATGADLESADWDVYSSAGTTRAGLVQPADHDLAMSDYTLDMMMEDMEVLFRYKSSSTKWMFAPRALLLRISQQGFFDGSSTWNFDVNKNAYGINIGSVSNPFGTLKIVECPALVGNWSDVALVVDPMGIGYRYFDGYDVQWRDIDYANNEAKVGQEIYADLGLEMSMPENHGMIVFT